jgi:hypothetical protein
MTRVFISYAASDPDWPQELVTGLANALQQHGAKVLFDQFYWRQLGRKPSDDEWLRWMRAGVKAADKIVCLCSPRYLEASNRDVADPSGYGVAFEAQKLIHQLYQDKGYNEGRISCVLRDGQSREQAVPDDLRSDCARYGWSSEQAVILGDLCGVGLQAGERVSPPPVEPEFVRHGEGRGRRHESYAIEHLKSAPDFFAALKGDLAGRQLHLAWFQADVSPFVAGLCQADKPVAHHLMWAIRRVLKARPRPIDNATRQAAVALYMLCACRWTQESEVRKHSGRVVRVPDMMINPIAVLAAAMFGGQLALQVGDGGDVRPVHAYEIRPAIGEDAALNLLLALFVALCPDHPMVPKVARLEKIADDELRRIRSQVKVRIDEIQQVDEVCLALVIDCPDVFEQAAWAAELNLRAFARDSQLVEDLFVVSPLDLDAEIQRFWKDLGADDRTAPSTRPPEAIKEIAVTPGSTSITINANGSQFALSTGDQSTSTNTVTQLKQGSDLKDLMPLLTELRGEIAALAAGAVREELAKQVALVEQAVQSRAADAKPKIEKGLDTIKTLAGVADSAEKLGGVVSKLIAAAGPIIGKLI